MGKVYQRSSFESSPVARFTGQELPLIKGTWLEGVKVNEKAGKEYANPDGSKKASKIFEFTLEDASPDLRIQKKNGKVYEDTNVKVGDTVTVFGNTQLDDLLHQVPINQKIRITYNGKKLNENSGRWFNDFTVEDK